MDARYQFDTVQTFGWDYARQEVVQATPSLAVNQEPGNLTNQQLSDVIQLSAYQLHHHARMDNNELDRFVDAVKQKGLLAQNQGKGKI